MLKPGFNYGLNDKTNFCIKTVQCEKTIIKEQINKIFLQLQWQPVSYLV